MVLITFFPFCCAFGMRMISFFYIVSSSLYPFGMWLGLGLRLVFMFCKG